MLKKRFNIEQLPNNIKYLKSMTNVIRKYTKI